MCVLLHIREVGVEWCLGPVLQVYKSNPLGRIIQLRVCTADRGTVLDNVIHCNVLFGLHTDVVVIESLTVAMCAS